MMASVLDPRHGSSKTEKSSLFSDSKKSPATDLDVMNKMKKTHPSDDALPHTYGIVHRQLKESIKSEPSQLHFENSTQGTLDFVNNGFTSSQSNASERQLYRKNRASAVLSSHLPEKNIHCLPEYTKQPIWTPGQKFILSLLILLSILTRFYYLSEPSDVVFNEVHFGNFVNNYLLNQHYFDIDPPLGKLLYAGMAYLTGYEGDFSFAYLNLDYLSAGAPYLELRSLSAMFGAAIVPLCFATLIECGVSSIPAFLGTFIVLFDNALVTESRFIVLDSIFHFFVVATFFSWVKFYKHRNNVHSRQWRLWQVALGLLCGFTISTKYVGIYTWAFVILVSLIDMARILKRKRTSLRELGRQIKERWFLIIAIPAVVYIFVHYVHFSILWKSGPGDIYMSQNFQRSLEGYRSEPVNEKIVFYGNSVTILNQAEKIYLHSHSFNYPLRHLDGKVSSQGQQVTGYPFEDDNNIWVIEPRLSGIEFNNVGHIPEAKSVLEDMSQVQLELTKSSKLPVRNKDVVRIRHLNTGKYLLSHDVASPLTKTNMEVAAFSNEDLGAQYNNTLFKVDMLPISPNVPLGTPPGPNNQPFIPTELITNMVKFRLDHFTKNAPLLNFRQNLPAEWGFQHREINCLKNDTSTLSVWTVSSTFIGRDSPMPVANKKKYIFMSFAQKFIEHQILYFKANTKTEGQHPYATSPLSWPFLTKGLSWWDNIVTRRQIYLIGNPIGWFVCLVGILVFMWKFARYCARRFRIPRYPSKSSNEPSVKDSPFTYQDYKFLNTGGFFFFAYCVHYLPFSLKGNLVFLTHYIPAFIMSASIVAFVLDSLMDVNGSTMKWTARALPVLPRAMKLMKWILVGLFVFSVLFGFLFFSPFTYGFPMTDEQGVARQWLPDWHYLVTLHPKPSGVVPKT